MLVCCILHNFILDQIHVMDDEKSTIIEKIWHDELEDDLRRMKTKITKITTMNHMGTMG